MIANTWMSFGTNSTLQCDRLHFPGAAQWPEERCAASSWTPPGVGMRGMDPGLGASPGSPVWGHPTTHTSSLQILPSSLPSPNKWVSVPDGKAQHLPLSRRARYYWMRTGMGGVTSPRGTGLLLPPRGLGAVGRGEEEGESRYCQYKPCTDILQTLGCKVVADNTKYAPCIGVQRQFDLSVGNYSETCTAMAHTGQCVWVDGRSGCQLLWAPCTSVKGSWPLSHQRPQLFQLQPVKSNDIKY